MRLAYIGSPDGFEAVTASAAGYAEAVLVEATLPALIEGLRDADALIDASMKVPIDARTLGGAQQLRVISTATTGSDHIDRAATEARGIRVHTLKEDPDILRDITPAAELSWTLLMACARRLVPAAEHVRSGQWVREQFPGIMLRGKTLGLVGCGRIGQWMSRYAHAFGMDVVGTDPFVDPWPAGITRATLDEVFAAADFVSVHVHLTDDTRGMIGARQFAATRRGGIFVNTSRGAIADEAALLDALESGHLGAAGLDVLEGEPDVAEHPLVRYARDHDNLIITPHCGGFSPDALRVVCAHATRKALAGLGVALPTTGT